MFRTACTFLALAVCSSLIAQDGPPEGAFPQPSKQHEVLKKFAGSWVTKASCTMVPGSDPIPSSGSIEGEMLGGFWVINRMEGNMAGMTFNAVQTMGYDPKQKKFVATWVDSMNDFMWKYDGKMEGNKLIFHAEGPHYLKPGEMMKYRDTYEFVSDDEIKTTSEGMVDGKWSAFMTGKATRVK